MTYGADIRYEEHLKNDNALLYFAWSRVVVIRYSDGMSPDHNAHLALISA